MARPSVFGLLVWFAYFVSKAPDVVVEQLGVGRGLRLTAGLAACVALTTGSC